MKRLIAVAAVGLPIIMMAQKQMPYQNPELMPNQSAELMPYQNPELMPEQRAQDLVKRLTLGEKVGLMMNGSKPVPRLGVPTFNWWSEALHGVGRNGVATIFSSCIGMAASFDDELIQEVFTAVSDEARAKAAIARREGTVDKYKCLSFWTPTINIFRDPRWGRGQETYGEDPYMTGRMGLRVVRGLQGPKESKYYKLLACAKHFGVHSGPESTRHSLDINNIPARDLHETYMPAFKQLVQEGDVREVMCAYQRLNGEACCGSANLLTRLLRDEWGFDGIVVSDCGAINDFYLPNRHGVAADAPAASALGVLSGTDVECGSIYRNLPQAVERGDISEDQIDQSVFRLLSERFRVGDFDADSLVEWSSISPDVIACEKHAQLALQMAREQLVLLKNNGILPLRPDNGGVIVMGPNADDSMTPWGIYYGQAPYTVTPLRGISRRVGDVDYMAACDITDPMVRESVYGSIVAPDGSAGLGGEYWNNVNFEGAPVAQQAYSTPLNLDNGGNTVFATGVNLTNFTARYQGRYTAQAEEELIMKFSNDDGLRIIVNGDTIHERWKTDPMSYRQKELNVKKGRTYDICIEYMQLADGATLNFDLVRQRPVSVDEILACCADKQTVVFVGGISPLLEREEASVRKPGFHGGDRTSIELPQVQRDILRALHDAGKQVVLVNCSGAAVALEPEMETCDAIVQAWYGGQEIGTAVAELLYGDFNPSGKLPVTFYRSDADIPDFEDYNMAGRTYRYFKGDPLFPFGYGLSYTTYQYGKPSFEAGALTVDEYGKPSFAGGVLSVEVENTGEMAGAEIVQVYVRRPADVDGPLRSLRGYARVALEPGEKRTVSIPMPASAFECWDEDRQCMRVIPDRYELSVGPSSSPSSLQSLTVEI